MKKIKAFIEKHYEQNVFLLLLAITVACSIAAAYGKWFVVTIILLVATHFGAKR